MITLIHGTDIYRSLKRAKEIFEAEKKRFKKSEAFSLDASEKKPEEIFVILEGHNLFSPNKVILFRNLTENKAYKELVDSLLETLNNLDKTTSLIFWESRKVSASTKFGKYFKGKKLEEVFDEAKKYEIKKIAKEQLQSAGIELDTQAMDTLLVRTNFDIAYLFNEIEKLKLLGRRTITEKDIREIVADSFESLIWDLTDAITESNKQKAVDTVDNLLKNEGEEFMLIPMIGRQLRLMLQVKDLLEEGKETSFIYKELKQPPFVISKITKYIDQISRSKLKSMFNKLVDLDYSIKVGMIEPKIALTLFCSLI